MWSRPLRDYFAIDPMVHVGGNLLLFYEEGNKRKHVSPDAFMVRGIPKFPLRDYYLLWEEGKPPDVVVEITSKTTRQEDQKKKRILYRDVLKIPEYFQFDPTEDYLKPSLQGVRRVGDEYLPIEPVDGRLPSAILGLHLERSGWELRLWDPVRGFRLLTPGEQRELLDNSEQEIAPNRRSNGCNAPMRPNSDGAMERQTATAAQKQLEAENERLRRELEAIRRGLSEGKKES